MLQIKMTIKHQLSPQLRHYKSVLCWIQNCVSLVLCFAPCRSHRVLGSHSTYQLGSRLSHAKPQRVTANSCCHAGAKTKLYCRCDYRPFTKSLQDAGPLSEGHSTTGFNFCNVVRFQTPSCNDKSPLNYFVLPISISVVISKPLIWSKLAVIRLVPSRLL